MQDLVLAERDDRERRGWRVGLAGAAGPKETSYTEEETSYAEAEPSHYLLTSVPISKSHVHQLVKNRYQ
ncbi:hypothetical protein EJB05_47441, partial [Eragrostis curvula]